MENTALCERTHSGNFSVAAREKLQPVAACPILGATELLLVTTGRTCFSLSARALTTKQLLASCSKEHTLGLASYG